MSRHIAPFLFLCLLSIFITSSALSHDDDLNPASPSSPKYDPNRIYLMYASFWGNLNNMIQIARNVYQMVLDSPLSHKITIITGETPYGEYLVEDYFMGFPGMQTIRFRDFMSLPNIHHIMRNAVVFAESIKDYADGRKRFFDSEKTFKKYGLKVPPIRLMKKRLPGQNCESALTKLKRAFHTCEQDHALPCKIIILTSPFANYYNCSKRGVRKANKLLNPQPYFRRPVQKAIEKDIPRPLLALHLRFLPFGTGQSLYGPHGSWKEGKSPNNMNFTQFLEDHVHFFDCMGRYGWQRPKSIYLLGWPSLITEYSRLFESAGFNVVSYDNVYFNSSDVASIKKGQWKRAFIDEVTSVNADYFLGMWRSTFSVLVAEFRESTKPQYTTILPDAQPHYLPVFQGSFEPVQCMKRYRRGI